MNDKLIGLPKDIKAYQEQLAGIQDLANNNDLIGINQEIDANPSPFFKRRAFIDKNLKVVRVTKECEALNEPYESLGIMLVIDSDNAQVGQYYYPFNEKFYDEPATIDYDYVVRFRNSQRREQKAFDQLKQKCTDLEKRESALRGALGLDKIDEQIKELLR